MIAMLRSFVNNKLQVMIDFQQNFISGSGCLDWLPQLLWAPRFYQDVLQSQFYFNMLHYLGYSTVCVHRFEKAFDAGPSLINRIKNVCNDAIKLRWNNGFNSYYLKRITARRSTLSLPFN